MPDFTQAMHVPLRAGMTRRLIVCLFQPSLLQYQTLKSFRGITNLAKMKHTCIYSWVRIRQAYTKTQKALKSMLIHHLCWTPIWDAFAWKGSMYSSILHVKVQMSCVWHTNRRRCLWPETATVKAFSGSFLSPTVFFAAVLHTVTWMLISLSHDSELSLSEPKCQKQAVPLFSPLLYVGNHQEAFRNSRG